MKKINIVIDGFVGVGKSIILKFLVSQFGYIYIDIGVMYRVVGFKVFKSNIFLYDSRKIVEILNLIDI